MLRNIGLMDSIWHDTPQVVACSQIAAFQSEDGGAHWYVIPSLPDALFAPGRNRPAAFRSGLARATSTFSIASPPILADRATVPDYRCFAGESDGSGQAWKQLDASRPPGDDGFLYPQMLDDGETLLLNVPDLSRQ